MGTMGDFGKISNFLPMARDRQSHIPSEKGRWLRNPKIRILIKLSKKSIPTTRGGSNRDFGCGGMQAEILPSGNFLPSGSHPLFF